MTKLIVVRHGQSHGNLLGLFMGWGNMPLTPLGRRQAMLAREALREERIDAAYASPLARAYETASIIVGDRELSVFPADDLREIYGGKWESVPYDDIGGLYPEDYRLWREDFGSSRPTDGESVAELYDRVKKEVLRIAAKHDGQTVLLASHATPIRVLQTAALGLPASEAASVQWAANASFSVYHSDGKTLTCEAYGRADHVGDLRTELPKNI